MFGLERFTFFNTKKLVVAVLVLLGAALILGGAYIFLIGMNMTLAECRPFFIMSALFVIVVIGAVCGD